jgi:aryl-alcohol dehydrogenase
MAKDGIFGIPFPAVFGHEGAGVVEAVGSDVRTIKPGDHVVLCQNSCGVCKTCRSGHPSNCAHVGDYNFSGAYPDGDTRLTTLDGAKVSSFFSQSSFATYAIADENNTIKIPDDFDLGLAGPLGCGIQTGAGAVINVMRPAAGETIVVFGAGGVGLSAIMAANICGCSEIIAVDAVPERLELARELGATYTINGKESPDIAAEVVRRTDGGVNYALECTGMPALVNPLLYSLTTFGKAGFVGTLGSVEIPVNFMEAIFKGSKTVFGIIEGDSIPQFFIPKLIQLYKDGEFPFDRLVKFFDFDQINEAFAESHNGNTVKPVLRF